MKTQQKIAAADLVNMTDPHLRLEIAYARPDNFLFGERIYKPDARLWLHRSLAAVIARAAQNAVNQGFRFVLYDGLRTVDAQQRMLDTERVRANPQWLQEPRLLSPPGTGAHPRGMAIDLSLETEDGNLLDMGTPFDFLAPDPSPDHNPAHRKYVRLTPQAADNRALLDRLLFGAAAELDIPLIGLAQEWWDYRLPAEIYESYAPLNDQDLPEPMRMTSPTERL